MTRSLQDVRRSVRSCYTSWSRSYYDEYYGKKAAVPPIHLGLIRRLLKDARARTVLDAGCGPASLLRSLANDGFDVYGFDLTPAMADEGRRVLEARGVPPGRLWVGDVLLRSSYRPPGRRRVPAYDAVLCVGVLPHIPEPQEDRLFSNLRAAVRPGGLVVVEARNQLFSLFTVNRYSFQFFRDELIRAQRLARGAARARVEEALKLLRRQFRMDLPPVRPGKPGAPGYDEILSRTHNPFVLRQQLTRAGFRDVRVLFYHYHAVPPLLEPRLGGLFRRASLAIEDPDDWRGHFMASAFLTAGRRA